MPGLWCFPELHLGACFGQGECSECCNRGSMPHPLHWWDCEESAARINIETLDGWTLWDETIVTKKWLYMTICFTIHDHTSYLRHDLRLTSFSFTSADSRMMPHLKSCCHMLWIFQIANVCTSESPHHSDSSCPLVTHQLTGNLRTLWDLIWGVATAKAERETSRGAKRERQREGRAWQGIAGQLMNFGVCLTVPEN